MQYEEELNAGYILSLQNTDHQLSVTRIAIEYPDKLTLILDKLEYFEENKQIFDVFDVERFVERSSFDKEGDYSYCWPYNYYEAFKTRAKIEKVDREKYFSKMEEIEGRVSLEYASLLKPKRWVRGHWEYLDETRRQELERMKREKIEKEQDELRQEALQDYILMRIQCLHSAIML